MGGVSCRGHPKPTVCCFISCWPSLLGSEAMGLSLKGTHLFNNYLSISSVVGVADMVRNQNNVEFIFQLGENMQDK